MRPQQNLILPNEELLYIKTQIEESKFDDLIRYFGDKFYQYNPNTGGYLLETEQRRDAVFSNIAAAIGGQDLYGGALQFEGWGIEPTELLDAKDISGIGTHIRNALLAAHLSKIESEIQSDTKSAMQIFFKINYVVSKKLHPDVLRDIIDIIEHQEPKLNQQTIDQIVQEIIKVPAHLNRFQLAIETMKKGIKQEADQQELDEDQRYKALLTLDPQLLKTRFLALTTFSPEKEKVLAEATQKLRQEIITEKLADFNKNPLVRTLTARINLIEKFGTDFAQQFKTNQLNIAEIINFTTRAKVDEIPDALIIDAIVKGIENIDTLAAFNKLAEQSNADPEILILLKKAGKTKEQKLSEKIDDTKRSFQNNQDAEAFLTALRKLDPNLRELSSYIQNAELAAVIIEHLKESTTPEDSRIVATAKIVITNDLKAALKKDGEIIVNKANIFSKYHSEAELRDVITEVMNNNLELAATFDPQILAQDQNLMQITQAIVESVLDQRFAGLQGQISNLFQRHYSDNPYDAENITAAVEFMVDFLDTLKSLSKKDAQRTQAAIKNISGGVLFQSDPNRELWFQQSLLFASNDIETQRLGQALMANLYQSSESKLVAALNLYKLSVGNSEDLRLLTSVLEGSPLDLNQKKSYYDYFLKLQPDVVLQKFILVADNNKPLSGAALEVLNARKRDLKNDGISTQVGLTSQESNFKNDFKNNSDHQYSDEQNKEILKKYTSYIKNNNIENIGQFIRHMADHVVMDLPSLVLLLNEISNSDKFNTGHLELLEEYIKDFGERATNSNWLDIATQFCSTKKAISPQIRLEAIRIILDRAPSLLAITTVGYDHSLPTKGIKTLVDIAVESQDPSIAKLVLEKLSASNSTLKNFDDLLVNAAKAANAVENLNSRRQIRESLFSRTSPLFKSQHPEPESEPKPEARKKSVFDKIGLTPRSKKPSLQEEQGESSSPRYVGTGEFSFIGVHTKPVSDKDLPKKYEEAKSKLAKAVKNKKTPPEEIVKETIKVLDRGERLVQKDKNNTKSISSTAKQLETEVLEAKNAFVQYARDNIFYGSAQEIGAKRAKIITYLTSENVAPKDAGAIMNFLETEVEKLKMPSTPRGNRLGSQQSNLSGSLDTPRESTPREDSPRVDAPQSPNLEVVDRDSSEESDSDHDQDPKPTQPRQGVPAINLNLLSQPTQTRQGASAFNPNLLNLAELIRAAPPVVRTTPSVATSANFASSTSTGQEVELGSTSHRSNSSGGSRQ
ncbi:MAG: hypothetical protein V4612_05500 [Pseudomonadota bacterium]